MNATTVVNLLIVAGLVAMMLSMGFKVTIEEVTASIRRPRLVAAGLVANFVLVPAATVGLLSVFRPHPLVSVAFLILAVCPAAKEEEPADEPECFDLELSDVRLVDSGSFERKAGPRYRLTYRNRGTTTTPKFHVSVAVDAGTKFTEQAEIVTVEVIGVKPGKSQSVDVRLPVEVLTMGTAADGKPAPSKPQHVDNGLCPFAASGAAALAAAEPKPLVGEAKYAAVTYTMAVALFAETPKPGAASARGPPSSALI